MDRNLPEKPTSAPVYYETWVVVMAYAVAAMVGVAAYALFTWS